MCKNSAARPGPSLDSCTIVCLRRVSAPHRKPRLTTLSSRSLLGTHDTSRRPRPMAERHRDRDHSTRLCSGPAWSPSLLVPIPNPHIGSWLFCCAALGCPHYRFRRARPERRARASPQPPPVLPLGAPATVAQPSPRGPCSQNTTQTEPRVPAPGLPSSSPCESGRGGSSASLSCSLAVAFHSAGVPQAPVHRGLVVPSGQPLG